jgi:hypothetical protein
MPLIGEIDEFVSAEIIVRHLAVGSFSIEMSSASPQARLIEPGRGIVVFIEGQLVPVFSGPIRSIKLTKNESDPGTLLVSGTCDNLWFNERIGRNDSEDTWNRETEGDWDGGLQLNSTTALLPDNSAEWIWHLVLMNYTLPYIDTFIDTSRRVKFMDLPSAPPPEVRALPDDDLFKGFADIHLKTIGEAVFELSRQAGLNTRFFWDPISEKVKLTCLPAVNKSNSVVFDEQVGNLVGYEIVSEAPSVTRVVMGGATPTEEKPRRYYRYVHSRLHNPPGWVSLWDNVGNPSSWSDPNWGRDAIEVSWNVTTEDYIDVRDTKYHPNPVGEVMPEPAAGSAELLKFNRAATAHFVENGAKGLVSLDAIDIPTCSFGVHYGIGEIVRCLIDTSILPPNIPDLDGVLRQQVQEVRLTSTSDELWIIKPTIGTDSTTTTPYVYRELRRLRRQVEETNERV